MRRLLCTALLLLCCAYGCIAAVVKPLPQKGQGPLDAYTASAVPAAQDQNKESFQPIRFAVSAKEVHRVMGYCQRPEKTPWNDEEDKQEYGFTLDKDRDEICSVPEDIVTPALKKTLLMEVLPAALKLHSERLSVEPVGDKLNLPFNITTGYPVLPNCERVSIPKEHLQGISNVDFVLYVGLTKEYERTQICSRNENGRPTSALIRFIPKEIAPTRHFIRFAAHEIAHALGFEIETMKNYTDIKEEQPQTKKTRLVACPTVVKKMKEQYNCNDDNVIKGMALENDFPDEVPPHWERRIAKDELMSTYTRDFDVTGAYYSALTLAVFDSMPFYRANFTMAESMGWGKNAGCDLLKGGEKDKIIKDHPEMFCTEIKRGLQCTSDRFALGRCTKYMELKDRQTISSSYAYFNDATHSDQNDLTDGCPIIKPIATTSCEDGNETLMPGSLVGKTSRCLKGEQLVLQKSNRLALSVGDVCADIRCGDGKVKVRYRGSDEWHECTDGRKIEVLGSSEFKSGSILCPNYTEVCTDLKSDIDFRLTYDKGEEERIRKEEEEEKRKKEATDRKKKEEEEDAQSEATAREQALAQPDPKGVSTSVSAESSADDSGKQQTIVPLATEKERPGGPMGEVKPQLSDREGVDVPAVTQVPATQSKTHDCSDDKSNITSPESMTTTAVGTVVGINDIQVGESMNHMGTFVRKGANSSTAASYYIPLLLLVCALLALGSP